MKVTRSYWPGQYWTEIADKKGWFQEAGLKVELIDINPDYFASLQDMVDGKMDSNNFALFDLMTFNLQGADLEMVVNTANSFGAESIISRQGIETIPDLRGKRIGVSKKTPIYHNGIFTCLIVNIFIYLNLRHHGRIYRIES